MRLLRTLCVRRYHNYDPELDPKVGTWSKAWANLPDRYILRKSRKLVHKSYPHPAFQQNLTLSPVPPPTMDRPWTQEYWQDKDAHRLDKRHGVFVQPIPESEWKWFKGDRVEVKTGKDKGKQGYINFVVQERNWVCVEGLNTTYETMGESSDFPGMGYLKEQPLTVTTDVDLVCPSDEKATEVEWRYTEDGERVRVSARTGHILPIPTEAMETVDYKSPQGYKENKDKDTMAKDVEEITFEPKLATFEMEVMESVGIREDRTPQKTFWY